MPKVHTVQKAQKDDPAFGIKKGDTYYWWKFRYGGVRKSTTYPKPSQLTQSSYLSTIYDIQERIAEATAADKDELESLVEDIKSELENLKEECESSLDNIPDQLKEGNSGQLLQERIDCLDNAISELEGIDLDYKEPEEGDVRDELKDNVDYTPTEEEEEDDDFDLDEKKKELVSDEDIEEKKAEHLQEWIDEKLSELQNISLE